jgi:type II secretory pathway component PulK
MKTNKRFNKSPRGFASVATVSTLVVFAAAGAALLEYQNAKLASQSDVNNIPQATFLAEGALQEAHYYITQVDSSFTGSSPEQPLTIGGKTLGTYDWQVTKAG